MSASKAGLSVASETVRAWSVGSGASTASCSPRTRRASNVCSSVQSTATFSQVKLESPERLSGNFSLTLPAASVSSVVLTLLVNAIRSFRFPVW